MLVAPRNAAANAGNKKVIPELGSAAPVVPTYKIPAIAPIKPDDMNAPTRIRSTLIPLKRATSRPRPT